MCVYFDIVRIGMRVCGRVARLKRVITFRNFADVEKTRNWVFFVRTRQVKVFN